MRWWVTAVTAFLIGGCGGEQGTEPADAGEQVYTRYCFSCHAAGIAGAPRVGDATAWAPRIAKGRDVLLRSSIEGVPPGMPPKGLCSQCSEEELAAAIDYMIAQSQ